MWKSILQSVVQDVATSGAVALAGHGFITANQEQGFVGSVVFLVMLAVNAYLQRTQTAQPPNAPASGQKAQP
jgi:hypothetical protein